ncbi:hypothetical protein GCM10025789_25660 [Tessaracoccus lubricantis]|uniref:Citrate transporter-like domain-containing protein n=1 Tax=Tessaracoccus lubricantis TaxID=545543 RepID=A0ABP9FL68_9ACTN
MLAVLAVVVVGLLALNDDNPAVLLLVAFIWGRTEALSSTLYEIVPGFIANLVIAVVVSLLTAPPSAEVVEAFEEAVVASRA